MKITIITPTYNRAKLLKTLYKSLISQASHNFEWLVIDDGSTDNTKEIIDEFISANPLFSIRYFYQPNGGKHRAVNLAVKKAKGDFCFIIDSDDFLAQDAVELIYQWIKDLPKDFAGVAGLKKLKNGDIVGGSGQAGFVDATNLERRKYNLLGDKAEVYRTAVLKKYPFPEFKGENFLSEAVVWNRIARDGYKVRWFSTPIYYCEYLEDGLSKNIRDKHRNSPQGFALYIRELAETENIFRRPILYGLYVRDVYDYKNLRQAAKDLKVSVFLVWSGTLIRKTLTIFNNVGILFKRSLWS